MNVSDLSIIRLEGHLVESECIEEIFSYIIQTIQDSGVGWYTQDDIQSYNITQG